MRVEIVTIAFPTGVLFDVMMRGGPLPSRYRGLGGGLMRPGPLEFSPDEAVAIRDWLALQPEGFIDLRDRHGAVGEIERALRIRGLCPRCGDPQTQDEAVLGRCRRCSE